MIYILKYESLSDFAQGTTGIVDVESSYRQKMICKIKVVFVSEVPTPGHYPQIQYADLGPALLTLKSFYLKAFSRKHGCDWLMPKHQPITTTLSAKSF